MLDFDWNKNSVLEWNISHEEDTALVETGNIEKQTRKMDPRLPQPVSREQIVAIIRQRAERNLDQVFISTEKVITKSPSGKLLGYSFSVLFCSVPTDQPKPQPRGKQFLAPKMRTWPGTLQQLYTRSESK